MVEIIREIGKGSQVLYAYHRNDQYARNKPYPMKLIALPDPTTNVLQSIEAAREPNDRHCKIDVLIHCSDAELLRDRLISNFGVTGAEGRTSKWITARPEAIASQWIFNEMPKDTPLNRQLRFMRKMLGITQTELGRRVGVGYQEVARMETSDPRASTVDRYCAAMGFKVYPASKY